MILQSFGIFIPSLLAGFGLIHLLWKSRDNGWALALKFFLGMGLGLGITSCLYFFRLVLFPGQGGYMFIQLGFLGILLFALVVQQRFSLDFSFRLPAFSWIQIFLALSAIFVLYSTLNYSLALVRNSPHGDYDAQAIWNLRARSMYRMGDMWEGAFSPDINRNFHMDYPLLIPLNVLGGWNTLDGEVFRVPAIQSILFLYGAAGMMFCLLAYTRAVSQASLALMLIITTPSLLLLTSFQTADIAVAYYFLSTTVLMILFFIEDKPQLLWLAGLTAALSAWTKNEGIPYWFATVLITAWMLKRQKKLVRLREVLAGSIIPIATIVLFKVHISFNQDNDLFAGNDLGVILSKVIDPARYISIITRLAVEIFQLGNWRISILVILTLYGLIMGMNKSIGVGNVNRLFILLPLSQLAIYFGIYVITPHDLVWHMNYSMSRLLLHLYPMVLLLFFFFLNTLEDALGFRLKNDKGVQ